MANTKKKQSHPSPLMGNRPGVPPVDLNNLRRPNFNGPKFNTSFRTQNRGGGGK